MKQEKKEEAKELLKKRKKYEQMLNTPAKKKKMFATIRDLVLEGHHMRGIANELRISESTLYNWRCYNFANFSDNYDTWCLEYQLKLAKANIKEILKMDDQDDIQRIKVKGDMSKFVAETLGRKQYSRRNEVTGEDGNPIEIKQITGMNIK